MTYEELHKQLSAEYDRVIAETLALLKRTKPLTKKKLAKALLDANKKYWAARIALLDADAVESADTFAAGLAAPYALASESFSNRVRNIYSGYQSAFDLSQAKAGELLKNASYDRTIAEELKQIADAMPMSEEKQQILAQLSAPAYRFRMERAEELSRQAREICDRIAKNEVRADREFLQTEIEKEHNILVDDVLGKTPADTVFDKVLPKSPGMDFTPTTDMGVMDSFSLVSEKHVKEITGKDWSGRNFSERVWKNTDDLAKEVRQVLLEGELTGASEAEMAAKIEKRFGVGMNKARRVVRTEHNYCINQAELKGMRDAGFDEYEFISLGEEAEGVCEVCDDLDGQRFKIADAVVGVNCPPMHPFCRCKVTTPQQTEEDIQREIDERIDSWNIPDDMTFDEFVERVNNGELEEIRKEQEEKELLSAAMSGEENSLNMLTTDNSGDIIKTEDVSSDQKARFIYDRMTDEQRAEVIQKGVNAGKPIFSYDRADNKFPTYAQNIAKEPHTFDVISHGTPDSMEFFKQDYPDGDIRANIDAYTLSEILKGREDYQEFIVECKEKGEEPIVRLLSCSTGNTDNTGNCFAQLVANELGHKVSAPTDKLYVEQNGEWYVGDKADGELKPFWSRK